MPAGTQLVDIGTYAYNADSQMTSLSEDKGATNLNSYTWSYDHDGRVTSDSSADGTDSFTYDATSQVTAATHSYQSNESYSYDANGNRTNTGDTTTTNNQLSSDGTYNYTYDNAGNLTKKTSIATGAYVTYTWDYHNRLTDVESYNSSNALQSHIHYTYDVFNRLIEKQTDPTGGGTYTTAQIFVYDGSNGIGLVYDGSGTLTDRILNGPGANNALADENGSGTISWLLADNEGTIRDVVQYNSGTNTTTIVDHLKYDSFGNITTQSNSAGQPLFAYTGQMWDAAAGLYYDHARWYDPHTGRFISQDPMAFTAGDPNLYRYVANGPTNGIDPTGMDVVVPAGSDPVKFAPPEGQDPAKTGGSSPNPGGAPAAGGVHIIRNNGSAPAFPPGLALGSGMESPWAPGTACGFPPVVNDPTNANDPTMLINRILAQIADQHLIDAQQIRWGQQQRLIVLQTLARTAALMVPLKLGLGCLAGDDWGFPDLPGDPGAENAGGPDPLDAEAKEWAESMMGPAEPGATGVGRGIGPLLPPGPSDGGLPGGGPRFGGGPAGGLPGVGPDTGTDGDWFNPTGPIGPPSKN